MSWAWKEREGGGGIPGGRYRSSKGLESGWDSDCSPQDSLRPDESTWTLRGQMSAHGPGLWASY